MPVATHFYHPLRGMDNGRLGRRRLSRCVDAADGYPTGGESYGAEVAGPSGKGCSGGEAAVRSSSGEAVERAQLPVTHRIAAGMPGVADDDQFRVGPDAGQRPRGVERSAQVEAAVDEDARDAGQTSGVAQQRAFLQPRTVRG